ncbi:hypothetical protein RFI_03760 [Reticulomyxa filosa]|uniref:Uncharacterized protein n=1 Tax=Reticulomyxa filosa TaxID=46433 RepID=X6P5H4_RETFI|nr:hypothetical protein RFI_03760 [Reticulomyxa filosa]|eukprot:ETO33344.1 hypothetical protein RFI_03760 [Reticulomyxa filosa]
MQKHICLVCKYMKEDIQLKTKENIEKYNNIKKEFSSYQAQFNNEKKQILPKITSKRNYQDKEEKEKEKVDDPFTLFPYCSTIKQTLKAHTIM